MTPFLQATGVNASLLLYKQEVNDEMKNILSWWSTYMIDEQKGGFYGSVNNENIPDVAADKGVVLNSRILWAFSAAYNFTKNQEYLQLASRSFEYIKNHFIDQDYGGVFWSVDANGKLKDGRKQIYGLAFCMYGIAEYFKATKDEIGLEIAKNLFKNIEQYSFDSEKSGYIEAFTHEWKNLDDLRLSEKDDNEKKTMNTHLHVIEAYANLYSVWPDKVLREKIESLLGIFDRHFINKETHHLHLFMDENWALRSSLVSFGHDIEAAWLLLECAAVINHEEYIQRYKLHAIDITNAAEEGLDKDGGLWYEFDPVSNMVIKEKHSWPQAEAMIGFINAYQLSGNEIYLQKSFSSWDFIKKNIKDYTNGEWFWGVAEDGSAMQKEKAGFWKCPYHSTRACLEINKRISAVL